MKIRDLDIRDLKRLVNCRTDDINNVLYDNGGPNHPVAIRYAAQNVHVVDTDRLRSITGQINELADIIDQLQGP